VLLPEIIKDADHMQIGSVAEYDVHEKLSPDGPPVADGGPGILQKVLSDLIVKTQLNTLPTLTLLLVKRLAKSKIQLHSDIRNIWNVDGKACGWLSKEIPCTREIPLVLQDPFYYVLLIQIELVSPCTTLYRDQDIFEGLFSHACRNTMSRSISPKYLSLYAV